MQKSLRSRFIIVGIIIGFVLLAGGAWFAAVSATQMRGNVIVVSIAVAAIAIGAVIWLANAVVTPVRQLGASADALRLWDSQRPVPLPAIAELAEVAEGFNRVAQTLAEFRRSNIGEVLRAKETLEATLSALPDAVFVIDPDGRISSMNPPARSVVSELGISARGFEELPLPQNYKARIAQALQGTTTSLARTDFSQIVPLMLGGRKCSLLPKAHPVPNFTAGRQGMVIVLYDVSEFTRLDELRSEMIAVASHELQTPLTTVRMNLMLLQENIGSLDERQREILNTALVGAEELSETIGELLDLTRIEAGQLKLSFDRVDLDFLVQQLGRSLSARFADAGIKFRVIPAARPVLVMGDVPRLKIALSNLLTNALKYTPYGGQVAVELSSMQNTGSPENPIWQIAVTDTGPGVPEQYRERIFEKFYRVEQNRTSGKATPRGAGIGLYLCRQIIAAHGGRLYYELGKDNVGSRFIINLPSTPPG